MWLDHPTLRTEYSFTFVCVVHTTFLVVFSKCLLRFGVQRVFCVVLCFGFCTGHFVMVPLNWTYLHFYNILSCQEHLFNLFCHFHLYEGNIKVVSGMHRPNCHYKRYRFVVTLYSYTFLFFSHSNYDVRVKLTTNG